MKDLEEALNIMVARTGHARYRELCDPTHPAYDPAFPPWIIAQAGMEPPPTLAYTRNVPPPHHLDIPLAGDVVESIAKRIGADRLARWWEKETGIPCGCEARKEALNRASAKLLKWLGIEATGSGEASAPAALAPPRTEGLHHPDQEPHGDE